VSYVKMRRDKETKAFVGSVFVEMGSVEEARDLVSKAAEIKWPGAEEPLSRVCMMEPWLAELKKSSSAKRERPADDVGASPSMSPVKRTMEKGCVVSITGLGGACTREDVKAACGEEDQIAYVDYFRGNEGAQVRFRSPEAATLGLAKLEGSGEELEIGGCKVDKVKLLEGDEEQQYWEKTWASMAEKRVSGNKRRFQNGGRGRGGGGFRKRGRR